MMKRCLVVAAAIVLCGCLAENGPLVLAERGRRSAYSVVVPDGASACIRHSAEEFTNYVAKLTGVELAIVGRVAEGGKAVRLKAVGGLGRDTFRFRTEGRDFLIEGDDDRAVLYGVYDFLENRCGCDWLTSTQEIIPSLARIEIPAEYSLVRKPAFEDREHTAADAYHHPDFAAKLKLGGYHTAQWKEIHGGPPKVQFDPWLWKCHTFTKILPPEKHFKDHPEWYAEVNGVRKGDGRVQLCLTNPEVLAKTIEVVKERIRKAYPKYRVFGVSQSDAWGFCTCPKCKALDEREGSHAGTIIAFVNEVAAAVEKEFPDVIIETLAYMYSRKPPKTLKPRDNVMICLCTDTCDCSKPMTESKYRFRHPGGKEVENSIVDDLRTWCAISKHVHIWDYTMNFQYKAHAFPNIYSLKPNIETFLDCGVTEVFEQGGAPSDHQAGTALRAYLIGHLLWDPRQPLEPLLDRFYRGYYGAAAPHMRQYMEELHAVSRSRDEVKNPMLMWGTLTSPALPTEFFEKGAAYYAKAAEAVKDDPVRLQNVRWEMNCNDYTRMMREKKPLEVGSPRFAEFQAAAKRILEDWERTPASANISEVVKIREEASRRFRALAAYDPKAGGTVDIAFPEKGPLKIAERGRKSAYSVVLAANPSPCVRHAAEEFTNYVAKLTGVVLPLVEGSAKGHSVFIRSKGLKENDAFRFRAEGRDFVIEGESDRAALFGVYDFLENRCGCEWLSACHEIVPARAEVEVPETFALERKPRFVNRECGWTEAYQNPDFAAKLKLTGFRFANVYTDRQGGKPPAFDSVLGICHTFMRILPPEKHFKAHPEWYAEVDGVRKGEGRVQLCLTNPEVLEKAIAFVKDRIRKNYPKVKCYGVSQSDAFGNCTCPKCKAIDEREGSPSGTVIEFVNRIAEAVEKEYPDVLIETLAYMYSRPAPKTLKCRDNVMITLCTDTCDLSRPLVGNRFRWRNQPPFAEDLVRWQKIARHIYVWDYALNFCWLWHAYPSLAVLKPNYRYFADCGVTHVYLEGGHHGRHAESSEIKLWIAAHLLWDPYQPVEPLMDRFLNGYFGAGAPFARKYYDEMSTLVKDETKTPQMMWGVIDSPALTDEFFEHAVGYWREAMAAVKGDGPRETNVRWAMNATDYTRLMRLKGRQDFASPRFRELVKAAKRIQKDLDGECWPEKRIFSESTEIDRRSRERIAGIAALSLKESGTVDIDALKVPKGTLQQAQ